MADRETLHGDRLDRLVWEACSLIPVGRTATYGDLGELLGIGPRRVGMAMARCPDPEVPWWRVTNVQGRLPAHLCAQARAHWEAEGTPLVPEHDRVRLRASRADPRQLGEAADAAGLNSIESPRGAWDNE